MSQTMYIPLSGLLLGVIFFLCHHECDSFLPQQQTTTAAATKAAFIKSIGQHRVVQVSPDGTGTTTSALSMGIVENFVSSTDIKTRNAKNEKFLAELQQRVERINGLEEGIEDLEDDELQSKTQSFQQRLKNGEDINGPLLEEAFAVVREAAW
jgi:hypothetical protein